MGEAEGLMIVAAFALIILSIGCCLQFTLHFGKLSFGLKATNLWLLPARHK